MDGRAMALNQRRRTIRDAIDSELEREAALLGQLEEMFAELEGPALDEAALAHLDAADADLVRSVLRGYDSGEVGPEDDEPDEEWGSVELEPAPGREELLAEVGRLEDEIALSRRRRDAYERYVQALDA